MSDDFSPHPVIAIGLMIAITVVLAVVIAVFVFGFSQQIERLPMNISSPSFSSKACNDYWDGYAAGFDDGRAQGITEGRIEALGNESVWHDTCVNEGLKIIMKSVLPEFEV